MLFPQRFVLPVGGEAHSSPVHIGILSEKAFKFLPERMGRIDGIEQVYDDGKRIEHSVDAGLPVGYPCV